MLRNCRFSSPKVFDLLTSLCRFSHPKMFDLLTSLRGFFIWQNLSLTRSHEVVYMKVHLNLRLSTNHMNARMRVVPYILVCFSFIQTLRGIHAKCVAISVLLQLYKEEAILWVTSAM
jgi:hypothetical protein